MEGTHDLQPLLLHDHGGEAAKRAEPQDPSLQAFDWLGRPAVTRGRKLGGKWTMFFTTGTICMWYTGYFGIFFNLVLFFRDVLGEGSGAAANDTNMWLGSMFLASLLGAFIAESFLGRLWTCTLSQVVAVAGMALMMIATRLVLSEQGVTGTMRVFFYISIYLLSIGCGASQSTLQALGADQFDEDGDKATFFTRYLILNNTGMILADTLVVYVVSSRGWLVGFGLATIIGAAGLIMFVSGIPLYRQYRHRGNPYKRALQVLVAAARKWRLEFPDNSDAPSKEGHMDVEGRPSAKHTDSFSLELLEPRERFFLLNKSIISSLIYLSLVIPQRDRCTYTGTLLPLVLQRNLFIYNASEALCLCAQ